VHDTDDPITIPPLTLGARPWAILREVLPRLTEAHRTPGGGDLVRLAARAAAGRPSAARRTATQRAGGAVAVLPLTGVLTPRGSFLSFLFGGSAGGLMDFRAAFREAVQSPDVGAIVLDVDSPGGLVDLVPETAAEVRDARGEKPIVAVANTLTASGAFWIAAQADELVVTPSGDVGSVGVYVVHEDWSAANEKIGITVTYVHAGRYKVEGNPDYPLDDDAQAAWQQEVDDLHAMFVDDVAEGRGVTAETVRDGYGEGRTLNAQRALAAGMVDRVDTLEAVIGGLLTPGATGTTAARAGRLALAGAHTDEPPPPDHDEAPGDTAGDEPPPELDDDSRAALAALLTT
jgi:capsid assembly protease